MILLLVYFILYVKVPTLLLVDPLISDEKWQKMTHYKNVADGWLLEGYILTNMSQRHILTAILNIARDQVCYTNVGVLCEIMKKYSKSPALGCQKTGNQMFQISPNLVYRSEDLNVCRKFRFWSSENNQY